MRWVGLFQRENIGLDVSASTGEHNAAGLIKQLLAGAHTVQVVSVLYQKGLEYMAQMLKGLSDWMKEKKYECIDDFRGSILNDPMNKTAFERLQFMQRNFAVLIYFISIVETKTNSYYIYRVITSEL